MALAREILQLIPLLTLEQWEAAVRPGCLSAFTPVFETGYLRLNLF